MKGLVFCLYIFHLSVFSYLCLCPSLAFAFLVFTNKDKDEDKRRLRRRRNFLFFFVCRFAALSPLSVCLPLSYFALSACLSVLSDVSPFPVLCWFWSCHGSSSHFLCCLSLILCVYWFDPGCVLCLLCVSLV